MVSEWEFYGAGRCDKENPPVGIDITSSLRLDGAFTPAGNIYYFERVSLERCGELCLSNEWCTFFSWKIRSQLGLQTKWCYISADCNNLANTAIRYLGKAETESNRFDTYVITSRKGSLDVFNSFFGHISKSLMYMYFLYLILI